MRDKDKQTESYESKARVLVVDDEPQVARTLRDILVYQGFDVEVTGNGRQALDHLFNSHPIDLIITDMRMPEMDGLELLKRVRQVRKDLPVIVLTGYATLKSGLEAIKEGVNEYLSKPFEVRELMRAVNEALGDKNRRLPYTKGAQESLTHRSTYRNRHHHTMSLSKGI